MQGRPDAVHPPEEVCSREKMRTLGSQPRILLTNVKQLELLLTRQVDVSLFADARLDFLVFDEAHTFSGINGAETACLIRRLRSFCGRDASQTTCVATSATIVDRKDSDAARKFASRFFGVAERCRGDGQRGIPARRVEATALPAADAGHRSQHPVGRDSGGRRCGESGAGSACGVPEANRSVALGGRLERGAVRGPAGERGGGADPRLAAAATGTVSAVGRA